MIVKTAAIAFLISQVCMVVAGLYPAFARPTIDFQHHDIPSMFTVAGSLKEESGAIVGNRNICISKIPTKCLTDRDLSKSCTFNTEESEFFEDCIRPHRCSFTDARGNFSFTVPNKDGAAGWALQLDEKVVHSFLNVGERTCQTCKPPRKTKKIEVKVKSTESPHQIQIIKEGPSWIEE